MNKLDLNVNSQACLKEINNIGNTIYQNVCNGKTATVPWGSGDWLAEILIFVLAFFGIAMLIVFVSSIIKTSSY